MPDKTLPDASQAGLPPKPPSGAVNLNPRLSHSPGAPMTPSPNQSQGARGGNHPELQHVYDKLLGGATTLSKREQEYILRYVEEHPEHVSPLMMSLIVSRVTNKTHSLSYRMMLWSYRYNQHEILENILTTTQFRFDVNEAHKQNLTSVQDVSDLMNCQKVSHQIRNRRKDDGQEKKDAKDGDVDDNIHDN
ncbi:hypothetical protein ONZ43_g6750 [Nemania bipapillata]|uniref:Uncharacterized protein n=1 Tax=Nemania bipapillata TaxID=110536 RepID=A0ACC2HW99_9PEZI|nr:hypothetical protein ONZ43_g6750 [Nemania bipapillata]